MRILINAGEKSGDKHGARLMVELLKINPSIKFFGFGGSEMTNVGLNSIADLSRLSVLGFWEVAKNFRFFNTLLKESKRMLINEKIDCFIPIDYPGFNLKLASFAKKNNIPVHYYIAPQLWAWGKNRAKKMVKSIDNLYVVFPFEEDYFRNYGINTTFVGHPLLDDEDYKTLPERKNLNMVRVAIMAGSRKQELQKHIPILRDAVKKLKLHYPDIKFGTVSSSGNNLELIHKLFPNGIEFKLYDKTSDLLNESYVGIIKSGTSNLEAALKGVPFTLIYKTSNITYLIGKQLMNVKWLSIINILLKKEIVKELIQKDFTSDNIVKETIKLIENNKVQENSFKTFNEIRSLLGSGYASQKAAETILNSII